MHNRAPESKGPVPMSTDDLRLIVLARDQGSRVQDTWKSLSELIANQPGQPGANRLDNAAGHAGVVWRPVLAA